MFPPRFLLYLSLSLALHLSSLALAGFWMSPAASGFNTHTANSRIQAKLLPLLDDSLPPLPIGAEKKFVESAPLLPRIGEATELPSTSIPRDQEHKPVIPLSVDDYLPPSRLDKIPKLIGSVDATVDFQGMTGIVGDAEIVLLISSKGDVDGVVMIESTLPDFLIDKVVSNFKKAKYEPGRLGSIPVRSRLRIRFQPPTRDELLGNPSSARERAWHR